LLDGVRLLAEALAQRGLTYALIGGLATAYRSRPRFTQDMDFLLQVPQLVLPNLLEELHERGFDFDEHDVIKEWNTDHVALLRYHGVRVDWLKPVLPIYQHVLERARSETWLGSTLRIASAEGLILTKLLAARGQDFLDIENLLAAHRGQLDLAWIEQEWNTIADVSDARYQRFQELLVQVDKPPAAS
jgi:hypothetical protein